MREFFARNIDRRGRIARAIFGAVEIFAAWLLREHPAPAVVLLLFGLFAIFEALRGWCIMRACGIKTRM